VLKPGTVPVERETEEVNSIQTNKEVRALTTGKKKKKTKKRVESYKLEHLTRADPWMGSAAVSMVDVPMWILMTIPTSILYLNWI